MDLKDDGIYSISDSFVVLSVGRSAARQSEASLANRDASNYREIEVAPVIIQGGMGVGVSGWRLAQAVSRTGQLGLVSGTALDTMLVRRLQDGDPGGDLRRALSAFPFPDVAGRILTRFYRPDGREPGAPYDLIPMYRRAASAFKQQLTVAANFVEVFLAREGHHGAVGINYLAKIQMPTLPSLFGAILAGADYVLMGAGIPKDIPGVLDQLALGRPARLRLDLEGTSPADAVEMEFDPAACGMPPAGDLKRPSFLPIVASNSLVTLLARKANGRVDGFVIEGPTAGGHNAPPRGRKNFNERGEPVYGPRDEVNLERVAEEGLPFWVAGGMGRPEQVKQAQASGAAGVQVGTLFAYCEESGLSDTIKESVVRRSRSERVDVRTDDRASPTGFPFKSVDIPDSVSSPEVYDARERICDLGYLRIAARQDDGRLIYRCPAEPVESFVAAGGEREETVGRRCLCNSLLANIGLGQIREDGSSEPTFVTSGDDLSHLGAFLGDRRTYSAADVIDYLLPN